MTAALPGKARPMPSLRAGLNAAPRERATQLALASGDTSWASSRPVPRGKRVADHAEREASGGVPFRHMGCVE
jgi:hypothetical protein